MRLRLTLLLLGWLCLAALAPAAPAPLPRRDRETTEARTWSKPVNGLRARLVCGNARYRLGDTLKLTLEIQNVTSGEMTLQEPPLSRYVCDPRDAGRDWAITSRLVEERSGKQTELLRDAVRVTREGRGRGDTVSLAAGEVLRIEISARTYQRGEGKPGDAKERERRKGEPRREQVDFSDADRPGVYEMRVTYRPDSDSTRSGEVRADRLTSPPLRIELVEPSSGRRRPAR